MKSIHKFCDKIILDGMTDKDYNAQGNTVHRMFYSADRYLIDFAQDFNAEHWAQYDTDQDANYFGVWVNADACRILTYCEGDWILVSCLDSEAFNREIAAMNAFYGKGYIAKTLDENGMTVYEQDREQFFIKP